MSSTSGHLLELTDTESSIKYPGNKNANFTVYGKETVVNSLTVNGLSPAQLAVASEDEEIDTAALADSFETLHVEYEKVDANANTAIGDSTTSYTLKVNDKDVLVDGDIISGKGVIFEEREDNKIEVASYYNSSSEITETLENVYTTGNLWYYCTKFAAGRFNFDTLKEIVIEHKNARASVAFWVHVYQGDEKEYKGVSTNSNSFVVNVPKTFTFDNLHIDKNKDLYVVLTKSSVQKSWETVVSEASNNQIMALLVSDEGHEDTVAISAEEENIKTGVSFVKSITGDSIKKVDLYEHATDSDLHVTPQLMQTWNDKQDALSDEQLITVNSGVTAEDKEKWDETTTIVNGKIVTNEEGLTETGYWANYFVVGGDNLISGSVKSIKVNYNFNEEKNIGGAANKYNETSWMHVFKTDKSTQIDASHDVTGSGVPSTWTLVAVSTNSVTPNDSNTGVWTFDNLTIDANYKYIFAFQSSEGNFNPNAMSKLAVLGFDDGTPDNKMRRYSDTARGAQFGTNLASMELYMATIRESLQDHIKDTNLHLTQADRDKLNSAVFSGTLTIANDRTSPQIFITSDTSEKNIYFDSNSTYTTGHTLQLNYANNQQNIIATADSFTYNGSNVLTESSAAFTTLQSAVSALEGSHFEVVDTLPATGKDNTIYLVPKAKSETSNVKDEYIYVNGAWEKIGDTSVDLTAYLKIEDAETTYVTKEVVDDKYDKTGGLINGSVNIGTGKNIKASCVIPNVTNPGAAGSIKIGSKTLTLTDRSSNQYAIHDLAEEITASELNVTATVDGTNIIITSKEEGSGPNGTEVITTGCLTNGTYTLASGTLEPKTNYELTLNGESLLSESTVYKELERLESQINVENAGFYSTSANTLNFLPAKWENKLIKCTVLWTPSQSITLADAITGVSKITVLAQDEPKANNTSVIEITQISQSKIIALITPNID